MGRAGADATEVQPPGLAL